MPKYQTRDVTMAREGNLVFKDYYWLCEDGDPTKALFWSRSAQCNKDKRVVEYNWKGYWQSAPNLKIVFIETAFVPNHFND